MSNLFSTTAYAADGDTVATQQPSFVEHDTFCSYICCDVFYYHPPTDQKGKRPPGFVKVFEDRR